MTTSAWDPVRQHPVTAVVERLQAELDTVAEASVWSMNPGDTEQTLTELSRLAARVAELELRVVAHADRCQAGVGVGATSTANWWAVTTQQTRTAAHRKLRLAVALDGDREPVRDALAAGEVAVDQARVIVAAVDALPTDLVGPETIRLAETTLIGYARDHDAKALKILGRRILDIIAPEIGEAHEARQLEAEEALAAQKARFTMSDDGHGSSHGRFTLPTLQAEMLRKQLMAIAAPKHQAATRGAGRQHDDEPGERPVDRKPLPHRMGLAFMEYIERYPTDLLPKAGGVAATVVVTMTLESLMGGLAAAALDTGGVISAGAARRLACEAGIIPAVLGGPSQVLDLGRKCRFHTEPQRVAMGIRDRGCTAQGCDWPPGMCHAHHNIPWARDGHTNVKDGRLLCPRHHTLAHDPCYATSHLPGGQVAFTRRT